MAYDPILQNLTLAILGFSSLDKIEKIRENTGNDVTPVKPKGGATASAPFKGEAQRSDDKTTKTNNSI